jgi:hypothetical protein
MIHTTRLICKIRYQGNFNKSAAGWMLKIDLKIDENWLTMTSMETDINQLLHQ